MDCPHARTLILDARRGRVAPADEEELRSHLSVCPACVRADAAEGALDELLDRELPRRAAPAALLARIERMADPSSGGEEGLEAPWRWRRYLAPALAACLALSLVAVLSERSSGRSAEARAAFVTEAVADHLRAISSDRGPELESGANHEVKPWFQGRLDFAPVVPLPDVTDLRLRGGSAGYFRDRKAAVVSYTLRRHAVTLLAFRADGLDLPGSPRPDGKVDVRTGGVHGFRVAYWRAGDVGYALVSDVAPGDLDSLATAFAAASVRTP